MAKADYVTNAICALITGAGAKTFSSPVRAAHAEFVAALAGPPAAYAADTGAIDLEDGADHSILDATAQNVTGGLDPRQIDAVLRTSCLR